MYSLVKPYTDALPSTHKPSPLVLEADGAKAAMLVARTRRDAAVVYSFIV